MKPLISETPRDDLRLCWLDEDLIDAIEALPLYGDLRITMHNGKLVKTFHVETAYQFSRKDRRERPTATERHAAQ